jgi:hypothetical protein
MNPNFNIASLGRLLGALSLACAAALPAHAAIPATPLVTEIFVNKNGVLGLAWNPIANAASVRVQVQTSGAAAYCKLDATKPAGCLVNQIVTLKGPLAPALNTGISVAAYNGGNVVVRLVAIDSTGKNWRSTGWIAAPRYRGMTSGGKAWPLASVESGKSLTVSATISNTTSMMDLWAFDINGNLPAKSRSGVNFTVTPVPVGNQAWVLKSKSGANGLVVDQGTVPVVAASVTAQQLGLMMLGNNYSKITLPYLEYYSGGPLGGGKFGGHHPGIDYRASMNTPVYSPVSGYVQKVDSLGYGQVGVKIDGTSTGFIFVHLASINVKVSQYVSKGCLIGYSGKTGATAPHLHVEAREGAYNGAFYFKDNKAVGVNKDPASVVKGYSAPSRLPC